MTSAGTMHDAVSARSGLAGGRPVGAATSVLSRSHSMAEVQLFQHSVCLMASRTELTKQLETYIPVPLFLC